MFRSNKQGFLLFFVVVICFVLLVKILSSDNIIGKKASKEVLRFKKIYSLFKDALHEMDRISKSIGYADETHELLNKIIKNGKEEKYGKLVKEKEEFESFLNNFTIQYPAADIIDIYGTSELYTKQRYFRGTSLTTDYKEIAVFKNLIDSIDSENTKALENSKGEIIWLYNNKEIGKLMCGRKIHNQYNFKPIGMLVISCNILKLFENILLDLNIKKEEVIINTGNTFLSLTNSKQTNIPDAVIALIQESKADSKTLLIKIENDIFFIDNSIHESITLIYRVKYEILSLEMIILLMIVIIITVLSMLGIVLYKTEKRRIKELEILGDIKEGKRPIDPGIKKAIQYIFDNSWNPDLCHEHVRALTGLSVNIFNSMFKRVTKTEFRKFLPNVRFLKVEKDLETTNKKITDIALDAGFSDIANFNRQFKKKHNLSPNEYRKKYKK